MPATDGSLYSFKYVNGHPKNTARGLLTVTAFGVLAAVDTGYPLLLSELTVTTALRTAATSALAARWLARPDSRVDGADRQRLAKRIPGARLPSPASAFAKCGFSTSIHSATAKLERNLAAMPELADLHVVRAASVTEACRGADIVTTVTADKRNAVILTPPMIEAGMHLNAVGGDCPGKTELHADILRMPNARVIVEYEPQSRIEGEIQQMGPDFPVTEFARDAFAVRRRAALAPADVTIFDSVGFALEDYSALRFLHSIVVRTTGRAAARSTWCRTCRTPRTCSAARSAAPAMPAGRALRAARPEPSCSSR